MSPKHTIILLPLLGLSLAVAAQAPKPGTSTAQKKLYCWDQGGQRICSDTLPPEAVNAARDEFSARSGLRRGQVDRALTEEEKAEASLQLARQQVEAAAMQTRRQTEQALLSSFNSETELRRVFDERVSLSDNNVQTARYNVTSLRQGLASLLGQAAERELQGQPVKDADAEAIVQRKRELNSQMRLLGIFEHQRQELDGEISQTLTRYRELKAAEAGTSAP